jgi:hypothetical protein
VTWLWLAIGLGAGFAGGVVLTWVWFELRLMKSPALLAPFGNIPSLAATIVGSGTRSQQISTKVTPIYAGGYAYGPDLDVNGNYVRHEIQMTKAEFSEQFESPAHWLPQSALPVAEPAVPTEPAVPLNLQIPETSDVKYPGTAAARDLAPFTVLDTTIALPPQKAWGALPYEDLPGMFVDQFLIRYFYTIIAEEPYGVAREVGVTPWQAFVQSNHWAKDMPELFWRLTSYHLSDRQLNEAIEMYTERIAKNKLDPVGVKRDG